MKSRGGLRIIFYILLIAGAILFSFPFVWMASTSFKLDRELFTQKIVVIPEEPLPRSVSPYYENRKFNKIELTQPQADLLLPILKAKIRKNAAALPPAQVDGDLADILAPGVFDLLARRTPAEIWNGNPDQLAKFAEQFTSAQRIAEIANLAYRELGLCVPRVRNKALRQTDLLPALSPAQKWSVIPPIAATLRNSSDSGVPYAAVDYDISSRDGFRLEQIFDLPFDVSELQRFQLRIRPDDTWHAITFTLESGGVKYVAERPFYLADNQWQTVTWQFPSADDESTKLKVWIVINEVARAPEFDHGRNKIRVTLDFKRSSRLTAGYAKAKYNYIRVLDQIPFWRYVRVSVLLVILNIVLTLLSSSLVAYAFARLQWPGRDLLFLVMLGTMMIPSQVTMIPNFLIWKTLGQYNTLTPLWAGAALGNAFFIFMMRQFLKGVPTDLEDAARIDGCGTLRIWWHVMLPLVKPSLAAIAIFNFIGTWNEFLAPLIYIADQRLYPLAFGLYAFNVQIENRPVLIMACALMMTLPVIVVFFAAQRYFIQGITLTGMKG